jgi:hypothetical protein
MSDDVVRDQENVVVVIPVSSVRIPPIQTVNFRDEIQKIVDGVTASSKVVKMIFESSFPTDEQMSEWSILYPFVIMRSSLSMDVLVDRRNHSDRVRIENVKFTDVDGDFKKIRFAKNGNGGHVIFNVQTGVCERDQDLVIVVSNDGRKTESRLMPFSSFIETCPFFNQNTDVDLWFDGLTG